MVSNKSEASASTRQEQIVAIGLDLVIEGGAPALTFDAIAERLGVSKQAILYWFPKKAMLVEALVLRSVRDEVAAAIEAIGDADLDAPERAFIARLVRFHLGDLDRFRLIYLVPQSGVVAADRRAGERRSGTDADPAVPGSIHQATGEMYGALADALARAHGLAPDEARRRAVVLHTSVLGLVTLVALADAVNDPLRHGTDDLIATLTRMMAPEDVR